MLASSSDLIQSKTQSKFSYKHQTRTQTQTPSLLSFAKFPQPDFASAIAFGATVSARPNIYNTRKDFRIPYSGFSPSIEMASSSSLYEILGIPISASGNEIKTAYRRLARMCHPDVVSFNQKDTSANEFMKIHEAYSTLSDPDKRANYDQDLFRRNRPFGSSPSPSSSSYRSSTMAAAAASMSSFSSYTSKKWETDQCW